MFGLGKSSSASQGGADENQKDVTVKFLKGSFSLKGRVYQSKEVEKKAAAGDVDALKVIADLMEVEGNKIIEVVNKGGA